MSQLPSEFYEVEHPVLDGSLLVHVVHFLVGEAVAHGRQQLAQVVFMQSAWKLNEIKNIKIIIEKKRLQFKSVNMLSITLFGLTPLQNWKTLKYLGHPKDSWWGYVDISGFLLFFSKNFVKKVTCWLLTYES